MTRRWVILGPLMLVAACHAAEPAGDGPSQAGGDPSAGDMAAGHGSERDGHDHAAAGRATGSAAADEVAFWTCPMHPAIQQPDPGSCPICGMTLVAVTRAEAESGAVRIDADRRLTYGIRTAPVERAILTRSVRAVGRVVPDETTVEVVTLRVEAWIRDLRVDQTGQSVKRGQVLATIYSPDLLSAQRELLALAGRDPDLEAAARDRLRLWGMTSGQVEDLLARGTASEEVAILSPIGGVVLDKGAVVGAAMAPGEVLYRIAALDHVWVEAELYEVDIPWIAVGQVVEVLLPYRPGEPRSGTISFLHPVLDPQTRTRRARVELDNADGALLPGMVADVSVAVDRGEVLVVPREAVIYTGPRRLVFVDEGDGRLAPRELTLGREGDDGFEVLAGLSQGEQVVTSGNFLVAAESRIRSATTIWSGQDHGTP